MKKRPYATPEHYAKSRPNYNGVLSPLLTTTLFLDNPEHERFMRYSLDSLPETTKRALILLIEWGYRDPKLQLFGRKNAI